MKTTINYSKKYASGSREGWAKTVTSVDSTAHNGYAFEGEFLRQGENSVDEGAVVIEMTPTGSAKNGVKTITILRAEGGGLVPIDGTDYDLHREIESLKTAVTEALGVKINPLADFSTAELEAEIARRNA